MVRADGAENLNFNLRIENWDAALDAVLDAHLLADAVWGASDCFRLPMAVVGALRGCEPPFSRVKYTTEAGAAKALRRNGFETIGHAMASVLPEIAPLQAGRGDVGVAVVGGVASGCVITNGGLIIKSQNRGWDIRPLILLSRAFAV